jgi:hypothetical protein
VEFKPFDVTAKELVRDGPAAWLEGLRVGPPEPVDVIDSDITASTAASDKVIRVGGPAPYLVNLELQSSHQTDLVETLWFRQAALFHRRRVPVLTVLVLLRREANSPSLTGSYEIWMTDGWRTNRYNYRVMRLWTQDPELYLSAGINLVPSARWPTSPLRHCPAWCSGWPRGATPSRSAGRRSFGRRPICSWGCVTRTSWRGSYWRECKTCRNRQRIRRS